MADDRVSAERTGTLARVRTVPATTALVVTGVVGGVVFVALMLGAASVYDAVTEAEGVAGLDRPVLDWAMGVRTPLADVVVTAFTNLGTTLPMVTIGGSLMLALYLTFRRRTIVVLMLVAAAGGVTFTIVGKALVGRSRPPLADAVPPYEDSFSFPSGRDAVGARDGPEPGVPRPPLAHRRGLRLALRPRVAGPADHRPSAAAAPPGSRGTLISHPCPVLGRVGLRPQDAGAMAQLVARFHGMEEATGSNPVSST